MTFTTDKKRIILATLFLLVSLFSLSYSYKFFVIENAANIMYFILSILGCFVITFLIGIKITMKDKKIRCFYTRILHIFTVIASYIMLELLNYQVLTNFSLKRCIINLLIIIVPGFITFLYSDKIKSALFTSLSCTYGLGLINYLFISLYGKPFVLFRVFSIMPTITIEKFYIFYQLLLPTIIFGITLLCIKNSSYEVKPINLKIFTRNIEWKLTKKSIICGFGFFVLGITFLLFKTECYVSTAAENAGYFYFTYYFLSLLLVILISLMIVFQVKPKKRFKKYYPIIMTIVSIVMTFVILELLNRNTFEAMISISWLKLLLNGLILLAFYFLVFAITNRLRLTLIINALFVYILGLIQYTVVSFRQTPFTPVDLLSAQTGLRVAGGYQFTVDMYLITATLLFILLLLLIWKIKKSLQKSLKNKIIRGVLLVYVIGFVTFIYQVNIKDKFQLQNDLWDQVTEYKINGFLASFTQRLTTLVYKKPEGYSHDKLNQILKEVTANDKEQQSDDTPNVIVIMNEAFSDISVNGDFATSEDYMPFYHSLTEDTIKGNAYVSVYGGTTANSEWEFLTNNSMFFLNPSHVPFQQYIHSDTYSLVSVLNDVGYTSKALHPYYASGYRRDYVYPFLGFSSFDTIDTLPEIETLDGRWYASDQYTYKQIIKQFEEKKEGEKLFSYTVTMQNHGGYSDPDFVSDVTLTDFDDPSANEYISLIKKSDEALEYLIDYFRDYEEDTIILVFGDHQPSDAEMTEAFNYRDTVDTETYNVTKYITPFLIWANYDIEEDEIEATSLNYLSILLLDTAGIETTPYMDYLRILQEEIPVINAYGYMDSQYVFHSKTDLGEYQNLLQEYEYLQYNNMFDNDKIDELFQVNDE